MIEPGDLPPAEREPDKLVYEDLGDEITYAFAEAFESVRAYSGRARAEFVQAVESLTDSRMFSVLLTESGGKPDKGVEKIRLLARPVHPETTVEYAAGVMEVGDELPFSTYEFFMAHQNRSGDYRFSRVDKTGIYPWLPQLRETSQGEQTSLSFDEVSILDFLRRPDTISEVDQEISGLIDEEYAKELIGKIAKWEIVPQN